MTLALNGAGFEMTDRSQRASRDHRRQRGRENETRRVRAHRIAQRPRRSDVAAHHAIALGKRAVDDIYLVHDTVALGNAAAARTVHANRVNLIEVGQSIVFFGQRANRGDGGNVAVHRVHAFKRDDLRRRDRHELQFGFEIAEIVVQENVLGSTAIANARDHRGVVFLIRKNHAAGQQLHQR